MAHTERKAVILIRNVNVIVTNTIKILLLDIKTYYAIKHPSINIQSRNIFVIIRIICN